MDRLTRLVSILALLASACTGEIGDPTATPEVLEPPGSPPPIPGVDPSACEDVSRDPGRVTLHRLNRVELGNTLRDLMGAAPSITDDFPADAESKDGFINNAETLTVGDVLVDRYDNLALTLSEESLTNATFQERYLDCDVAAMGTEVCGRHFVEAFGRRAFRRPVTEAEVARYMTFVDDADDFDSGVQLATRAILMAPSFLFRPEPVGARDLSAHELATRLSYFLWATMPDEELDALADNGDLLEDVTLRAQVQRMIADDRFDQFVGEFATRWLHTSHLHEVAPAPSVFDSFDEDLQHAMDEETRLFVEHIVRENLPLTTLLKADFTYLNERLANHYGIEGVTGDEFRYVELDDARRGGLLTQASILTVTSHPDRTSPVKRGEYVLDRLLCSPPPAPPDNVDALPGDEPDEEGRVLSVRERLEQHRADPVCAACHDLMDPIGFALESYDGIGQWRTEDRNGAPLDTTGVLPDGQTFDDAASLADVLNEDPRFLGCVTEKLATYALGRETTEEDACILGDVLGRVGSDNPTLRDLLVELVMDDLFRTVGEERVTTTTESEGE